MWCLNLYHSLFWKSKTNSCWQRKSVPSTTKAIRWSATTKQCFTRPPIIWKYTCEYWYECRMTESLLLLFSIEFEVKVFEWNLSAPYHIARYRGSWVYQHLYLYITNLAYYVCCLCLGGTVASMIVLYSLLIWGEPATPCKCPSIVSLPAFSCNVACLPHVKHLN